MKKLLHEISGCAICAAHLPHGPRPVVQASGRARILVIGQAPGRIVHETGVPWNDQSGDNLRRWLSVTREQFYDPAIFALMPMGFCYPGTGKSGDLPPRPECAPQWHAQLLKQMKHIRLTLLIGQYAQAHYLGNAAEESLTETVKQYRRYLPAFFPLPHPSPRNNIWQKKNPWFGKNLLPELTSEISLIIEST